MTFETFIQAVDRLLINLIGLDHDSIEDWHWHDCFADEMSPQEAVLDWRAEVLTHYGVGENAI